MQDSPDVLLEAVVALLDTDTGTAGLRGYSDPIKAPLSTWQSDHERQELPREVRWEICALDLRAVPRSDRPKGTDERFQPMFEWLNPDSDPPTVTIYPDVDGLLGDEEAIDYYRQRAEATPNRCGKRATLTLCGLHSPRRKTEKRTVTG